MDRTTAAQSTAQLIEDKGVTHLSERQLEAALGAVCEQAALTHPQHEASVAWCT